LLGFNRISLRQIQPCNATALKNASVSTTGSHISAISAQERESESNEAVRPAFLLL